MLRSIFHPSAQSAALFSFTGSYSGYQTDPSQLPEDMVRTGRYSCFPNRLHTAVCGNNEKTVEAANSQQCAAVFVSSQNNYTLSLTLFAHGLQSGAYGASRAVKGVSQTLNTKEKAIK